MVPYRKNNPTIPTTVMVFYLQALVHWILLVPIVMYSFQLWGIINENTDIDEVELIWIFPLMMVLIPAVYLIRAKLFNSVRGNDLESFEKDLLVQKSLWGQIKDLFQ
jgi:hypothetical protein